MGIRARDRPGPQPGGLQGPGQAKRPPGKAGDHGQQQGLRPRGLQGQGRAGGPPGSHLEPFLQHFHRIYSETDRFRAIALNCNRPYSVPVTRKVIRFLRYTSASISDHMFPRLSNVIFSPMSCTYIVLYKIYEKLL